jgi:site-specific DNA-methyltransferase (adenine-specific)
MTGLDLRLGRWETALADVEPDALIVDPPYGPRTHKGARSTQASVRGKQRKPGAGVGSVLVDYDCWTRSDVLAFVGSWHERTKGWICAFTSHDLIPHWEDAFAWAGRYCFAPLPVLLRSVPRLAGDGPGSGAVWLVVARPRRREFMGWGSLPAWYQRQGGDVESSRAGGKPLHVMRQIVADYSKPGDLVCDPMAGGGMTLAAALAEGRRAVGAEMDPEVHAAAVERIAGTSTGSAEQRGLFE